MDLVYIVEEVSLIMNEFVKIVSGWLLKYEFVVCMVNNFFCKVEFVEEKFEGFIDG